MFQGEEEFGTERLIAAFRAHLFPDAERILDLLWAELATFSSNAPQTDDMTALAICHLDSSQQELVNA